MFLCLLKIRWDKARYILFESITVNDHVERNVQRKKCRGDKNVKRKTCGFSLKRETISTPDYLRCFNSAQSFTSLKIQSVWSMLQINHHSVKLHHHILFKENILSLSVWGSVRGHCSCELIFVINTEFLWSFVFFSVLMFLLCCTTNQGKWSCPVTRP